MINPNGHDGEFVKLSCFDYVFTELFGFYFYGSRLDVNELQNSLDDTVELIPILSSRIVSLGCEKEPNLHFEIIKPSIVKIVEKNVEDDLHSLYYPNEKGILNSEESSLLYKHCEAVELERIPIFPKLGVPVLKITLIQAPKGSVLAFSSTHALFDAHALTHFMDAWSAGRNRKINSFHLSRELFVKSKEFSFEDMKSREKSSLLAYHLPLRTHLKEEVGFHILPKELGVQIVIRFSSKRLDEMKSVAKLGSKGCRISSNDCISAFCWKLHAILRGRRVKSGVVPFMIIMNARHRYSKLDSSYFGNFVILPNVDLSYEEILKMSFGETTRKIRELINSVDDELCEDAINCMSHLHYNSEHRKIFFEKIGRNTSLWMNDWRLLDQMKPHFHLDDDSSCRCERVLLNPLHKFLILQVMTVNLSSASDGDGLEVTIPLRKKEYEVIKEFEVGDLSTLKFLEELEKKCEVLI